jgi:hypothetical protein
MDSCLKKLLAQDIITPMEAYMKASVKKEFAHLVGDEDMAH